MPIYAELKIRVKLDDSIPDIEGCETEQDLADWFRKILEFQFAPNESHSADLDYTILSSDIQVSITTE